MDQVIELVPGKLLISDLKKIHDAACIIRLSPTCKEKIDQATAVVNQVIDDGRIVYGINTGFGLLANRRIKVSELETLQRSIVLSHAAGIGKLMANSTVRLLMLLKINSLARGYSGVRFELIEALVLLLNQKIYPCIPTKGSVGASGDLAPLAHMSAILLGEGEASYNGEIINANLALEIAGLKPVTLAPKEGLALLNGTQASTALAIEGLFYAETCINAATVIGAMSVEAARGSHKPFDARIHAARGHQSQIDMAGYYRQMLDKSAIEASHRDCEKVQDPYSLRCQPQVMGACLQQIRNASEVVMIEVNAVSDNPLIFCGDQSAILSGGNFHAEPIAMIADNLALAIAEIGALSERRMALLIDSQLSGLPPFLVKNGGVNSGFMIAQVTAAALASENKSLAHPACVDSLPTSANQEDHVSMATFGARRLADMFENTVGILAVEWLGAAQGLDFLNPLKSSNAVERGRALLRSSVAFYSQDRYFSPDIKRACQLIETQCLNNIVNVSVIR
ncbi:MAG: histidine ammonia-lyase [Pseudomonadales bacterium]|nr:histidine ammonia-lyase [Pseudomonadales bacterium]